MKSRSRKIEKTLAWIANIILISVVVLMYTGFFERQLEAIFLTPEFISLTLSKFGDAFFLYTGIDAYRMVEFFIKYIKYFISKYFYSHRHGFNTEIRMNMTYITTTLYFLQILFSVNERATAPYGDIQTSLMRLPSSRLFLTFDVFSDFP